MCCQRPEPECVLRPVPNATQEFGLVAEQHTQMECLEDASCVGIYTAASGGSGLLNCTDVLPAASPNDCIMLQQKAVRNASAWMFARLGQTGQRYEQRQCLAPALAVVASVMSHDLRFVDSWALDVTRQSLSYSWQVVVASPSSSVLLSVAHSFKRHMGSLALKSGRLTIDLIKMRGDPGLYETWDMLLRSFAAAPILTNWNVDDRKHPECLARKLAILQSRPEVLVVTSSVLVSHRPGADWYGASRGCGFNASSPERYDPLCTWWYRPDDSAPCPLKSSWGYRPWCTWSSQRGGRSDYARELSISELFRSDPQSGRLTGAENIPHNSPMWRRSLLDKAGYFTHGSPLVPRIGTCHDWALWVRAAREGAIWHINYPLESYFVNAGSHERRNDQKAMRRCILTQLTQFAQHGLYNNVNFWEWASVRPRMNVLIVHEILPVVTQGGNQRLRQIVEWFRDNGHDVTLAVRDSNLGWMGEEIYNEVHSWLARYGVRLLKDDVSLGATRHLVLNDPEVVDVAIIGLWFWREYRHSASDTDADKTSFEWLQPLLRGPEQHAKIVVLSDDVHWMRCRQISKTSDVKNGKGCTRFKHIREQERDAYDQADLVLAISDEDAKVFRHEAPNAVVATFPMAILPVQNPVVNQREDAPLHFMYLGSPHEANLQAVRFLMLEVAPLMARTVPDFHLTVSGGREWIEVLDEVLAKHPSLDVGCNLAPDL